MVVKGEAIMKENKVILVVNSNECTTTYYADGTVTVEPAMKSVGYKLPF